MNRPYSSREMTYAQKVAILLKMGVSCFTDEEREKMRQVIDTYDRAKASKVIEQLDRKIRERTCSNPIKII